MLGFFLLSLLTVVGGVVTITARNAVHAALGLVGTLISVAGIYATLNASFLAATQVIVYAGAVMVLFLFVVMLLNAHRPVTQRDPLPFVAPLAGIAGTVLAGAFALLAFTYQEPHDLSVAAAALRNGGPGPVGETLLTRFLLPFEAVSILLLVAVVGSVALVQRPVTQLEPETHNGSVVSSQERGPAEQRQPQRVRA